MKVKVEAIMYFGVLALVILSAHLIDSLMIATEARKPIEIVDNVMPADSIETDYSQTTKPWPEIDPAAGGIINNEG